MNLYIYTFKNEGGDKNKNNNLMSLSIDDDNLLQKYQTISTTIKDLRNIEYDALPIYDDRYLKTKITAYDEKVYTNFCGLNVSEEGVECESFTLIPMTESFR